MKNNETLNKYIAGLVDGDGCITTNYQETRNGTYKARLHFSIVFEKVHNVRKHIEEIMDYFGCGSIYDRSDKNVLIYQIPSADKAISAIEKIKKHLVIKGQHAERMIKLYKETRGYGNTLSKEEAEDKKAFVKWSREHTSSIKPKKHLTNPWLAGYTDADGHLSIIENNMCLDYGCAVQDKPALDLIAKAFGREIKEGRDNEIRLRHYFSKTNPTLAKRILIPLLPHLRLKKWNAEQILASYKKNTRRD